MKRMTVRSSLLVAFAVFLAPVLAGPAAAQSESNHGQAPVGHSVEDVLARAIDANPDVRSALLTVLASRQGTRATEEARGPVATASLNGSYRESFAGTTDGVVRNNSQDVALGLGLSWTSDVGSVVSIDLSSSASWRTVNRDPGTSTSVSIGPNYQSQLLATFRQPLLRGGGRDAVLATEREAQATERQTIAQQEVAVSAVVRDVLLAYWELWYAERALAVQVEAQSLAERQLAEAEQRVELGALAPAEALRFRSSLASLRDSRRSAELLRTTRRIELARLLATSPTAIDVADTPPTTRPLGELRALLQTAESHSPDLVALAASVEAAEQRLRAARNQSRAQLDFVASAGLLTFWADDALPGAQLPGGRPGFVATGGLELELPIGSSAQDARHEQASTLLASAELDHEAGIGLLRATLESRYEEVLAATERVPLATESASIAEQLAEAERGRLELGTTTTIALLEAQQTARESELGRLRAEVDTATAMHRLEHDAGILVDRFGLQPVASAASASSTAPRSASAGSTPARSETAR